MAVPERAWVRATATRWVSDEPVPGVVEVLLEDAQGRLWRFQDKAPMFDESEILTSDAHYPMNLKVACTVLGTREEEGQKVVDISTADPWGLESVDGISVFTMRPPQVVC